MDLFLLLQFKGRRFVSAFLVIVAANRPPDDPGLPQRP